MKIVLVSHGEFTTYLLKSAEMILGDQKENSIVTVNFYADDSVETLKNRVTAQLEKFKDEELLILTDIKGGTPCNVSFLLSKQYNLRLIAGVNLPMLLEILLVTQEKLTDELIQTIMPSMLPLISTFVLVRLLRKKITPNRLILGIFAVALLLSALKILV